MHEAIAHIHKHADLLREEAPKSDEQGRLTDETVRVLKESGGIRLLQAKAKHDDEKLGYDIESAMPGTGRLRFLEVKGRVTGADSITVTRNEILYALNKPDDFILAIVEFLENLKVV